MQELDAIRLVVALRAARAAVGWSQEELALHLGMAKTTLFDKVKKYGLG